MTAILQRWVPLRELADQSGSRRASQRLRALTTMREQLARRTVQGYFKLARPLVWDRSNRCRWQAVIVIGEFIKSRPDSVWEVVAAASRTQDDDLKNAIATVLLEHLLEHYFEAYFTRLVHQVQQGDTELVDVLARCWPFGDACAEWGRVQQFLESCGEDPKLPWDD